MYEDSWGPYKLACAADMLSNSSVLVQTHSSIPSNYDVYFISYFPTNQIPLPDGTAIPAWAAIDRKFFDNSVEPYRTSCIASQWSSQTFSPTQAKQIADQGKLQYIHQSSR